MKLKADHSKVCKFGQSQTDQDNLELVQSNIEDIYEAALKKCELNTSPFIVDQEGKVPVDDNELEFRFANLRANRT